MQVHTLVALSLILLSPVCDREVCLPDPTSGDLSTANPEELTLSGLARLDDYPLYVMTYHGGYGFQEFLETGHRPDLAINSPPQYQWGCTCFTGSIDDGSRILGRNFDWPYESIPLLLFTDPPGGLASVSVVNLSYFGYSRENLPDSAADRSSLLDTPWLPFDGMNEKGVAIGMMAVPHAESPRDPAKITLGEIELIRLVLDHAENLDHAISLVRSYNIRMEEPPIHYLIADSSGQSAIIEFLDGRMEIILNAKSWQVSTNFVFSELDDPFRAGCWRFQRASEILEGIGGCMSRSSSMTLLDSVSNANTIWSVLYNMGSGEIRIVPGRRYSNVYQYSLYDR